MKAGTVIFALSVVLWVLVTFPSAPADATRPAIDYSFAGMLGHVIEPIFAPIGFTLADVYCINLRGWQHERSRRPRFRYRSYAVGDVGDEIINQTYDSYHSCSMGLSNSLFIFGILCICAYVFGHACRDST